MMERSPGKVLGVPGLRAKGGVAGPQTGAGGGEESEGEGHKEEAEAGGRRTVGARVSGIRVGQTPSK